MLSALLGPASHAFVDGFTPDWRWGAQWLALDRPMGELPFLGRMTIANTLQYLGHTGGSLVGLALLIHVGRHRLLERWYGPEAVEVERSVTVAPAQRMAFWVVALPPTVVGVWRTTERQGAIFATMLALVVGLLVAGTLPLHRPVRSPHRRPTEALWRG